MTSEPEPTQSVNIPRPASGPPPSSPPPAAPPPPAPAAKPKQPMDRAALVRAGLGVLVVGLIVLGLAVEENESTGYDTYTTWAIFATAMAAVHLLPLVWKAEPRRVWDVVAVATGGLVFYWVAIVLPFVGTGTSFAQTLAVVCALAHLWLLPGRR